MAKKAPSSVLSASASLMEKSQNEPTRIPITQTTTTPRKQAAGMAMICRAGEKLGVTELGTAKAVCDTLRRFDLPTNTDYNTGDLVSAALSDKKRSGGTITFVVPERIGKCVLITEPVEALGRYIELGKDK